MKKIYLIAIAMITVLAAVSCAPDPSITKYDWEPVHNQRTQQATGDYQVSANATRFPLTASDTVRVSLVFPPNADIVRAGNIEQELANILSFHHFETDKTYAEAQVNGYTVTLGSAVSYTVAETYTANYNSVPTNVLNAVYLDFNIPVSTSFTDFIIKFNKDSYTLFDGLKLDLDNNGVRGEAGYDEYYQYVSIPGSSTTVHNTTPGYAGWYITFDGNCLTGQTLTWGTNATNANTIASIAVATINLPGPASYLTSATTDLRDAARARYKAVGEQFAGNFTLKKFNASSNSWATAYTAVYEPVGTTFDSIVFKDVIFEHNTSYRVEWAGEANITAAGGDYRDLAQRIWVSGGLNNGVTTLNTTQRYKRTSAVSAIRHILNGALLNEITNTYPTPSGAFTLDKYASDTKNTSVVLRLEVPILGSSPNFVGLEQLQLSDFQGENAAFKIIYNYNSANGTFVTKKINAISYAKEGNLPSGGTKNTTIDNVLYITLEPNEKYGVVSLFINDKFKYTGNNPVRVFGDASNVFNGKYRRYTVTSSPITLQEGIWEAGNIDEGGQTFSYTFASIPGEKYVVRWSSIWEGNGDTLYADVSIDNGSWLNSNCGWNKPEVITASGTTVTINVRGYNSSTSYTGTYKVRYDKVSTLTHTLNLNEWVQCDFGSTVDAANPRLFFYQLDSTGVDRWFFSDSSDNASAAGYTGDFTLFVNDLTVAKGSSVNGVQITSSSDTEGFLMIRPKYDNGVGTFAIRVQDNNTRVPQVP